MEEPVKGTEQGGDESTLGCPTWQKIKTGRTTLHLLHHTFLQQMYCSLPIFLFLHV